LPLPELGRRALLGVALAAAASRRAAAEGLMDGAAAVAAMRAGGLNLYIRHAITDRAQADTGRRGDRAGQRNLDARGRAQATALGQAFVRARIPVGRVFTSEVFRAADTAALMFGEGRAQVLDVLIADDYTPRSPAADAAAIQGRLAQVPPDGANDVFIGHIVPFAMIIGRSLSQAAFPEGAIGLLRPDGRGFAVLGIAAAEAVIAAA
jgi:phosphohistidine phosphatase SixA